MCGRLKQTHGAKEVRAECLPRPRAGFEVVLLMAHKESAVFGDLISSPFFTCDFHTDRVVCFPPVTIHPPKPELHDTQEELMYYSNA